MINRKSFVIVFSAGPLVMIKCTVPHIPYSRHKLTYENEAVFFAYSYITPNSQTRGTSLLFCWGPGVLCRQPADGWLQAGNSPPPFFLSFGSRRGFCGSGDEAPGAGLGDASLWRMRHSPTGCDKGSSVNEKDTGLLMQTKRVLNSEL